MHADARHTLHTSLEQALGPEPAVILMDALDACATKQDLRTLKRELVHELDLRFGVVDEQFRTVTEQFRSVEERFNAMDRSVEERFRSVEDRFRQVDERFTQVDERFKQVDDRFRQVDERFNRVEDLLLALNARLDGLGGELRGWSRTLVWQVGALMLVFMSGTGILQVLASR